MSKPMTKSAIWGAALLLLVAVAYFVGSTVYQARMAADYSAHAALTEEICRELEAVRPGQFFPASLSELRLSFPGGSTPSMLSRFNYSSSGTSCTVRTSLLGKEFSRSYP